MRVAIQGELGSNSHMAVLAMLTDVSPNTLHIAPCTASADVLATLIAGTVDAAVLPIENSLHGSVAEHYDLLFTHPVHIVRESLLRIRHNLIAAPGVTLDQLRVVLSHPVALSQCRLALARLAQPTAANPAGIRAQSFYDTAGSVKHLITHALTDTAALAPALAAETYGATILQPGIEDHEQNFTRFHLLLRNIEQSHKPATSHLPSELSSRPERDSFIVTRSGEIRGSANPTLALSSRPNLADPTPKIVISTEGAPLRRSGETRVSLPPPQTIDKMSLAFSLEHRPGSLAAALQALATLGVDLTQIESRPVPGRPWEYVFYVDLRLATPTMADEALQSLTPHCTLVKELGRYPAA